MKTEKLLAFCHPPHFFFSQLLLYLFFICYFCPHNLFLFVSKHKCCTIFVSIFVFVSYLQHPLPFLFNFSPSFLYFPRFLPFNVCLSSCPSLSLSSLIPSFLSLTMEKICLFTSKIWISAPIFQRRRERPILVLVFFFFSLSLPPSLSLSLSIALYLSPAFLVVALPFFLCSFLSSLHSPPLLLSSPLLYFLSPCSFPPPHPLLCFSSSPFFASLSPPSFPIGRNAISPILCPLPTPLLFSLPPSLLCFVLSRFHPPPKNDAPSSRTIKRVFNSIAISFDIQRYKDIIFKHRVTHENKNNVWDRKTDIITLWNKKIKKERDGVFHISFFIPDLQRIGPIKRLLAGNLSPTCANFKMWSVFVHPHNQDKSSHDFDGTTSWVDSRKLKWRHELTSWTTVFVDNIVFVLDIISNPTMLHLAGNFLWNLRHLTANLHENHTAKWRHALSNSLCMNQTFPWIVVLGQFHEQESLIPWWVVQRVSRPSNNSYRPKFLEKRQERPFPPFSRNFLLSHLALFCPPDSLYVCSHALWKQTSKVKITEPKHANRSCQQKTHTHAHVACGGHVFIWRMFIWPHNHCHSGAHTWTMNDSDWTCHVFAKMCHAFLTLTQDTLIWSSLLFSDWSWPYCLKNVMVKTWRSLYWVSICGEWISNLVVTLFLCFHHSTARPEPCALPDVLLQPLQKLQDGRHQPDQLFQPDLASPTCSSR